MCVPVTRQYFKDKGRDILSLLYQNYNKVMYPSSYDDKDHVITQDTSTLVQHYDELLDYAENNVPDVVEELKQRGVIVCGRYTVMYCKP